ncbi:PREDICTED: uncharacterized protein LOC109182070 [Ipomoea nil]|uniref:uncharacterized protein LOC109182070 n=1 Tax=Ipomoea nil TaxID=35883 RepID=UPI0009017573|nr:PREDICTED: uncharacterized protein LOC109182070 [Ipomoea nil]
MLSVMSNKGFDSDRRNDAVAVPDLRASTASSSAAVNGEVSSVSTHSGDAKASEDVENGGGMDLDRGVSLVSDDSAIRNEDRKLNAEEGKELGSEVVNLEDKGGTELIHGFGNSIIDDERSNGTEGNSVVSEYDLMLSKFDDFAANGRRWTVGLGFEMGDMVWGKVKSHPWWPGHIFNEAFATTSVQRSRKDDHILVAFFGDSSYGWFEPADLVPFDSNFHEKSQQTNSRSFAKAVEEAVEELSRRCALGLLCRCSRQVDSFRPLPDDEGFFKVDLSDTDTNFVYTASQIKKARESFHPRETLTFAKKLALTPMSGDYGNINFIKNRATALAYRKAVFAPHDPTYAEAFGAHVPKHLQQSQSKPSKEPQRASLSGRLISMEAMGKGKTSVRHNKATGQTEKDRYLFKRRDEPENLKSRKVAEVQAGSSSQPIHVDSSVFLGKGSSASVNDNTKSTSGATSIEELKQPPKQDAAVGELHRSGQVQDCVGEMHISAPTEAKPQGEGFRVRSHGGAQKVKNRKRPASGSETNQLLEKKKKKKKKILSMNEGSNLVEKQVGGAVERIVNQKSEGDSVPVPSGTREDIQMDNQQKGDGASISSNEQAVPQQAIGIKSVELELPQVLCDLQTLALNPFHGMERSCPTSTRSVFLRFRSLVFQKSLASSPAENESNQVPSSKLPASDGAPAERIREAAPVKMPPKPSARPDDPTRGGRKRSPSDRQEELSAKKKKKMNDLKLLAAEKKGPQRASEVPKSEMVTKMPSSIPTKLSKPDVSKRIEHSPRVPEPTMLIMKFPPNGALPSIPELKAKFARFGPLDHSGTRIFWKSSTCRLVYRYKHHAESALKFAESSTNLFGNTDVKCSLREAEAAETSISKVSSREDSYALGGSQSKDLMSDRLPPASRQLQQQQQQPVQLKSCLKRPPGGGEEAAAGNGNNRGTTPRVKFDLGGEDSSRGELLMSMSNDSKNTKTGSAASSSSDSTTNIKNFSKVIPPPSPSPQLTAQFQNPPTTNVHLPEVVMPHRNMHNFNTHPHHASSSAPPPPPPLASTTNIDISQQMISLLTKCHEVVTNLTNVLGYPSYRPL